jgi:F-type H+-transporting ATPase subunit b
LERQLKGAFMEHGHFLFWKTVNTIILIAILYYFLKKPIAKFFSEGMNAIVNRFESAKKDKEEALSLLKEAERKSEEAKKEAQKILLMAEELAEREKSQIIEEAKATADRIIKTSNEEIEREIQRAKSELQNYAALKAIELAQEKIKEKMSPKVNSKIIESNLSQIAKEGAS